ncbi:hypothetical protein [Roseateles sp. P5_E8]
MATDNHIAELLDAICPPARRGWWMASRETASGDRHVFFFLSFHVHPESASETEDLIRGAIAQNAGLIRWTLVHGQAGRFLFCPEDLVQRVRQPPAVSGYTDDELHVAREAYSAIPSFVECLNAIPR